MKKIRILSAVLFVLMAGGFAQDAESVEAIAEPETEIAEDSENEDSDESEGIVKLSAEDLEVIIPSKKKPLPPDSEKAEKAALKDEGKNAVSDKKETIAYGIETEILSLIKDLIANDDPRFSDDLYELFYATKNVQVREKIIEYFTKIKDPCIEDYAVEVLQDPYDIKDSTVELVFRYVSEVKTKEAVSCVLKLLESDDDTYFNGALTTIGEIGGKSEAKYLVEYLERDELTLNQRQNLMKVLGRLKAESTWDKLSEICQDEEENSFVRMYAAEAIGAMKKPESVPILIKLFESPDPNFRVYVIKGLSNYDDKHSKEVIIQGIKDGHWKVRQEAIECVEKMKLEEAVPYVIYRAKNDPENVIKDKAYGVLSKLENAEANKFLVETITDEKATDNAKGKAAEALLKNSKTGYSEISELALKIGADDKRKPFRYTIGKLIAKYPDSHFDAVCLLYLESKDAQTCALGLDMYASGRYLKAESKVKEISENEKLGANYRKARKILKVE